MDTPAPCQHAAYDRHVERLNRLAAIWRSTGRIASAVFFIAVTAILVALLAVSVADLAQPQIWGTFTATGCEPRPRGGCRAVGTWTSDDGELVRHDVYLDGWMDESDSIRASYQPTAILGGESSRIVHTPTLTGAGPWVSGALLLLWVGRVFWGDVRRALVRARTGSVARTSPRRAYRRSLDEARRAGADVEGG